MTGISEDYRADYSAWCRVTEAGEDKVTKFFITLIVFHDLTLEIDCCGNMILGNQI